MVDVCTELRKMNDLKNIILPCEHRKNINTILLSNFIHTKHGCVLLKKVTYVEKTKRKNCIQTFRIFNLYKGTFVYLARSGLKHQVS